MNIRVKGSNDIGLTSETRLDYLPILGSILAPLNRRSQLRRHQNRLRPLLPFRNWLIARTWSATSFAE